MDGESLGSGGGGDDIQGLIDTIKSSELVEARIQLLVKVKNSVPVVNSDRDALLEFFTTLWEGFTCLDVSQCMLNKAILDVATKYLDGDCSSCQGKLLTMGSMASNWCAKHLKMTLMSTDDSQEEEHYGLIFQLLQECLNFSAGCISLVTRSPILEDELVMDVLNKFILEQLNLIKDLISEIKKIHTFTSELLKGAEVVLDSATRLCKCYADRVNWELHELINHQDNSSMVSKEVASLNRVAQLIKLTVEKLTELGTLAASGGGSLVTVLNLSWKGVVSLLQLGRGSLAGMVNVGEIIIILISLASDSLRCTSETWFSSLEQTISVTEAKRTFLPIKFYLINAVRLVSQYPHQAFSVYQESVLCILLLSTLRVNFSTETCLKNVCEAMEELLKPTSLHLLKSLLNAAQLTKDQKLQMLDGFFGFEGQAYSFHPDQRAHFQKASLDDILSVTCEAMPRARALLLGRVALFIDLLKSSIDVNDDILPGIANKLYWLFDALVDEELYACTLVLKIPASSGVNKSLTIAWEPMLVSMLHSLKVFMTLLSGTPAWSQVEFFLLENFIHPHFFCWEIIMELWCFLVHHADSNTVTAVMDKICALYKLVASSDSDFSPHSALRKVARSICILLTSCTSSASNQVYRYILTDDRSHLSAVMLAALLLEGFQLNLLSDNLKIAARERVLNDYIQFVGDNSGSLVKSCNSNLFGLPVAALSSALRSMQIDVSDVDTKTLKLLLASVSMLRSSPAKIIKSHYCRLLSDALMIMSSAKHLYGNDQMEQLIVELENMFISGPPGLESELKKCKPALTSFMGSLGHVEIAETEECRRTSAVWQLYHLLLRDQHWALIHLAISAFGFFAARTSCRQLWRFVPADAALSFDLESGTNPNEERFMSELKVFLEKEMALPAAAASSSEQLDLTFKDGLILRKLFLKKSYLSSESTGCEMKEIIENLPNKRRKLPDGFTRGMGILQNGLKILAGSLSLWQEAQHDYADLDENILAQFSRLEHVVNHLAGLADSG